MRIKLFLLLAFLALNVQAATVVTNVSRLSGFGFVGSLKSTDYVAISVKQDATLTNDRLRAITGVNFASSLTNYLGIASTGYVNLVVNNASNSLISTITNSSGVLSNSIISMITNGVVLSGGTNVIIESSVTSTSITYTINVGTNGGGGSTVSPPLSSVQYNSNSVLSGSSAFVFTNGLVGMGTNIPSYPLHIFATDITKPALELSYASGAGNTRAFQIRAGTGVTNIAADVDGSFRSVSIFNSVTITSATVTANALNVTGGTLGAGKVLTDTGGTGAATWETSAATSVPLTPGVTNVASAAVIVIDLAATNTPLVSVTNVAAHDISIVVSNPYPGRWFSFYIDGSGVVTNNILTWSSVPGVQLKWLDAVTNVLVISNGFVNVSGWIATMNRNTNMVITYRDE